MIVEPTTEGSLITLAYLINHSPVPQQWWLRCGYFQVFVRYEDKRLPDAIAARRTLTVSAMSADEPYMTIRKDVARCGAVLFSFMRWLSKLPEGLKSTDIVSIWVENVTQEPWWPLFDARGFTGYNTGCIRHYFKHIK